MVPNPIASDPRLYGALIVVLALVLVGQRFLGWRRYRMIHGLKRVVFPLLNNRDGLFLVSTKGWRDDAEFVTTVDMGVRATWTRLVDAGGSPHLLSSVKRRPLPDGGTQLSAAHVVWTHNDGIQTEAYLFVAPDGGCDVYAHAETTVLDPSGHMTDAQTDGDPRGIIHDALEG